MRLRGRRLVPNRHAPLLLLLFLLPAGVAVADEPGKLLPDPDGAGAVVLRFDGTIEHLDMTALKVTHLRWPGESARPVDIARPGKGSVIYTIVPEDDGRTTLLEAHDISGEAGPTMELKGRGRFLEVTEDGRFACVAGTKPGSKDEAPDRWILTVVDIATGEAAAPIAIGFVPTAMALRGRDGILARLFITGEGRVATFSMVPPRPSWFYRSPGVHHDIALPAASPVVCLLRDQTFAVIDPQRWERDEGRVRSSTDDATTIVDLGRPGGSIALSPDGRRAAVLAPDGQSIALIDVAAARIDRTIDLQESSDLAARVMTSTDDDAGDARLLLASRGAPGSRLTWLEVPASAAPPPPPVVVAAAVETPPAHDAGAQAQDAGASAPAQSAAASTPAETAEGKDDAAAPAGQSAPTVEPGEPVTEQPASPEPTGPQPPAGSSPDEPAEAAPEEVAAATPPEQEKQHEPAAQAPRLSGHIQGEIPAGLHVLLYGPDNVLRLAGRAPVAPEGVWQIPIPPAGRYRLVVSAGAERHLFVSPEYRTIVITGSGEPMNDIDFEIRGSLQ